MSDKYFTVKKYGREFLKVLELRSTPVTEDILKAVGILIGSTGIPIFQMIEQLSPQCSIFRE